MSRSTSHTVSKGLQHKRLWLNSSATCLENSFFFVPSLERLPAQTGSSGLPEYTYVKLGVQPPVGTEPRGAGRGRLEEQTPVSLHAATELQPQQHGWRVPFSVSVGRIKQPPETQQQHTTRSFLNIQLGLQIWGASRLCPLLTLRAGSGGPEIPDP